MTRNLTNAETIVLARVAEYELFNEQPALFDEVAFDAEDMSALVQLARKEMVVVDLPSAWVCMTDAGIEVFEAMVASERGRGRVNPFYDHGYDPAA